MQTHYALHYQMDVSETFIVTSGFIDAHSVNKQLAN